MTATARRPLPRSLFVVSLPACLLALATACSSEAPPPPAPSGAAAPGLPKGLFVTTEPSGAKDVDDAKKAAKAGEQVRLVGRIGGRVQPFVAGRAVFSVVSPKLKTCADIEGDSCETPWDYCCEDRTSLVANTATVRVVDDKGAPLPIELNGQGGLAPGAKVVVEGRVHEAGEAFVVDAERVYVAGR